MVVVCEFKLFARHFGSPVGYLPIVLWVWFSRTRYVIWRIYFCTLFDFLEATRPHRLTYAKRTVCLFANYYASFYFMLIFLRGQ